MDGKRLSKAEHDFSLFRSFVDHHRRSQGRKIVILLSNSIRKTSTK
jgi:hypothetical protein